MAIIVPIIADTKGFGKNLDSAGGKLKKFGKLAAVALVALTGAAIVKSISNASDLAEQISKSNVVFGKSAKTIEAWSKTTASSLGLSQRGALEAASQFALFAKSAGLSSGGAADFSKELVTLAADMASFNNRSIEDTIGAIGAALRGENEPIRSFGVLIDDASLRMQALKMGIIETTKDALTPQQKVLAAQALILKQTSTAQGDFARTSEGVANQSRIAKAQIENLSATLGNVFLPIVAKALGVVTSFIGELSKRPTFRAKIEFIIEKLRDATGSLFTNLADWWSKSKALSGPTTVEIKVALSGSERVDAWFAGLVPKAGPAGASAGKRFVGFFFSKEGGGNFGTRMSAWWKDASDNIVSRVGASAMNAAVAYVSGFVAEAIREIDKLAPGIRDAIKSMFTFDISLGPGDNAPGWLKNLLPSSRRALSGFSEAVKKNIADAIADAVQSARANLASLGSSVGGLLGTLRASPLSKQSAAIRKQLKMEADARDKLRLEGAVLSAETDDEKEAAARDLDIFLRNLEAERLDDAATAAQDAAQSQVDNLIAVFNNGGSLADLMAGLNDILGSVNGDSLGAAFAQAWGNAMSGVVAQAAAIAASPGAAALGAGAPISPGAAGVEVTAGYFKELENWQQAKAAIVERLRLARGRRDREKRDAKLVDSPGGATITDAEQKEINAAQKRVNSLVAQESNHQAKRPKKSDFSALAMGGILKKQVFTAGEAGPEAVIPLNSSRGVGMLAAALGGGQGNAGATYNIVVNAGLGTNPDELSRIIVESIRRFEKRNGQVFSGPILSTTTNTSGKTDTGVGATDFSRITTLRSK